MTREESAILSAYTGLLLGPFDAMHEYIERLMERPVFTHEMGNPEFSARVKEKARPDFMKLVKSVK